MVSTPPRTHTYTHTHTHTHVHTPILTLSRDTHYFFDFYSPSLHTHARTLKQNTRTHTQFNIQIHTHTQTDRYVARVCDNMCLQAREQGRERKRAQTKEKERAREKWSVYFGALAWMLAMRASISCIRACVNAFACKNSQTDHRWIQTEKDTDIQRLCVLACMRVHVSRHMCVLRAD